jgi:hypothetical protein
LARTANRATLPGMSWHKVPKGDRWKEATLAMLVTIGRRAWLRCDHCGHDVTREPREFADQHGLDMRTPLFMITLALRCTKCGTQRARCGVSPYESSRGRM